MLFIWFGSWGTEGFQSAVVCEAESHGAFTLPPAAERDMNGWYLDVVQWKSQP